MTVIKRTAAILGAMVFCLGLAHAAHAEPLTSQQVERFIASMPELTALGEKHADNQPRNIDPARPLGSSLELMDRQSPSYSDLSELASRHGFSSPEQWADVGDRVMSTYAVASSGLPTSEVDAAYKEAVANIKKNPDLPAAKKEAILAGMEKGHQRNMNARQASEQDISAVRPHMAKLDKLFE